MTSPASPPRLLTLFALSYALAALVCLSGCSGDIDSVYGQRKGPGASASVNGTAVLGEMFEQAGHQVFSWQSLSPRLSRRAACIVWFPDDFEPPREEVCEWLKNWLTDAPGRTLVYVGRDFDAAPWYWQHVLPDVPPEQRPLVDERLATAKRRFTAARRRSSDKGDACEFFSVDDSPQLRQARKLEGVPGWLDGIEPSTLEIELRSRLSPPASAVALLKSEGDVLVSRQTVGESQLLVVANGSFLLNLPLVNHEHRKLAGKLIDEIGPPGQKVAFLESGSGGPPIRDRDPAAGTPTGLELFATWPTNWILLHLAALGVIFCFSRWPILGRPNDVANNGGSDFRRHVDALADLLKRSRDRDYANERIQHYRQQTALERTKPEP